MKQLAKYLRVIIPFVWIGFVCAISFMEASIKFTPPEVSLNTGLAIGKVVFSALNKVELAAAVIIAVAMLYDGKWVWRVNALYLAAIAILFTQSVWILPYLSERIDLYLAGHTPQPSSIHFYFVVMEALKIIALLLYGTKQLTLWKTSPH